MQCSTLRDPAAQPDTPGPKKAEGPRLDVDPTFYDEETTLRQYARDRPKAKKRDWSVWRNFFRFGWR